MARIRTIKPSFFTSLTIAELTPEQRLTFIGLWTHVDDAGRCVADTRLIKAAIWPLDDRTAADVMTDLGAITDASLIRHYKVGNRRYLQVNGWVEHQVINRPKPSTIPGPDDPLAEPLTWANTPVTDASVTDHGRVSAGKEGKGKEGKGKARASGDGATPPTSVEQAVAAEAYEAVGKAFNFVAVRSIVKWAIETRGADPDAVRDAVVAIYQLGKPITKQTLGQYLDGHLGRQGGRPSDRQADILRREMDAAIAWDAQHEHDQPKEITS